MTAVRMVLWLLCLSAAIGCRGPTEETHQALDPLDQLKENGVEPKTLIIGVPPAVGSSAMEKRVGPLADYLQSSLNVKVEIRGASSYRELIASLRNKELHAAILSPLSYVQARKSLPVVPVASASSGGSPTYVGYLVVAADSPYRSLEQLRGARVAWVDHGSTSGYLYPRAMMRWRNVDPDRFFGKQTFAGNHFDGIRKVAHGDVDVAAVGSAFVDRGEGRRIPEADLVRVIAKTSRIPLDCVVIRKDLSRKFARRFKQALLTLDEHGKASTDLTQTWGIGGFVAADDHRYDPIADVLKSEQAARR